MKTIEKYYALKQERQKKEQELRRVKKQEVCDEIKLHKERLRELHPFTFLITPLDEITNRYMTLFSNKNYLLDKMEVYKDTKVPGKFEKLIYFILEFLFGVWIIYFLLYRSLGSELFKEITPSFGMNIDPLYISLVLEGIIIIMFSVAMKLFITSRFDESKKRYVNKIFKYSLFTFIFSFLAFIWLSSI